PHKGDKRDVRRRTTGKFTTRQANVGRSLSDDRRSRAKTTVTRATVTVATQHPSKDPPPIQRCTFEQPGRSESGARSEMQQFRNGVLHSMEPTVRIPVVKGWTCIEWLVH